MILFVDTIQIIKLNPTIKDGTKWMINQINNSVIIYFLKKFKNII